MDEDNEAKIIEKSVSRLDFSGILGLFCCLDEVADGCGPEWDGVQLAFDVVEDEVRSNSARVAVMSGEPGLQVAATAATAAEDH